MKIISRYIRKSLKFGCYFSRGVSVNDIVYGRCILSLYMGGLKKDQNLGARLLIVDNHG